MDAPVSPTPLRDSSPVPSHDAAAVRTACRPVLHELLTAYDRALHAAEDLPWLVWLRTRRRRPRLWRPVPALPRPRPLLGVFVVRHITGRLQALERVYARRAALGTADPGDESDLAAIRRFRESLPPAPMKLLIALLLATVLIVSQLLVAPATAWLSRSSTAAEQQTTTAAASAAWDEPWALGLSRRQVADALRRLEVDELPPLIEQALAVGPLEVTSIGQLLGALRTAGFVALAVLVGYLAIVVYLTLRPFVAAFRLKRVVFNLDPDAAGYLPQTSAPWHLSRSTGVYEAEAAAFRAVSDRTGPREQPFDLIVLALPAAVLLVVGLLGAIVGASNWARDYVAVRAEVHAVFVALGLAALGAGPAAARLGWLWWAGRRRDAVGDRATLPRELTVPPGRDTLLLRSPTMLAVGTGVPLAALWSFTSLVAVERMWGNALLLAWASGLLVVGTTFPWWHRVAREVRDAGRASDVSTGRWPLVAALLFAGVWLFTYSWLLWLFEGHAGLLSWLLLVALTAPAAAYVAVLSRRLARLERNAGVPTPRPAWWLPALGVVLPPVTLPLLQQRLNRLWLAAAEPVSEAVHVMRLEPLTPPRRRAEGRRAAAVLGIALVAFVGVVVARAEPGPDGPGDDATLDGLAEACAAGTLSACDTLFLDSPVGSEYEVIGGSCGYRHADWSHAGACASLAEPRD